MSALLDAISGGVRIVDLAQPLFNGMPCSPNHPGFRMSLLRRHGDVMRPDGSSAANELIVTGGHVGTHIDALSHVSYRDRLHGDVSASAAQVGGKFSHAGVETIEPMVCRGVLLDVAAAVGADILPGGYGVSVEDLEKAALRAGVEPREGDVAVIRTGWARNFTTTDAFLGTTTGVPGLTEEAGRWLVGKGVRATGSDTAAYEQIHPDVGHGLLPVHRLLLVEHGIHIIEMLDLEELAAASAGEFLFVLSPLKIVGGTGSPVRPLAVVDR